MYYEVKLAFEPTVTEADLGRVAHFTHTPIGSELAEDDDDEKRIATAVSCFKRRHLSVFEFAELVFDVTCPIYVARQLVRHRNGTFMEKSLRCLKPNYYGEVELPQIDADPIELAVYNDALKIYDDLVKSGERKEKARAILPLCTPTEFLWRISLRSLLNVFDQRLTPDAQEETRNVVKEMWNLACKYYPNILDAYAARNAVEIATGTNRREIQD